MERKINFDKNLQELLGKLDVNHKPKLLLHACCGPCFTIPYEVLKDHFDITIIYNNSNIYPEEEYNRRLNELKSYLTHLNVNIKIIELPYDNLTYNKFLKEYGEMPEGHERCRACFRKRLDFGYRFAVENNFDFFGTVMTISRYKNAQDINKIGFELQEKYPSVKWLPADFKKNNGYEKSLTIIKENNMYFQEYCGCIYSYKKYQEKIKK